MRFVAILYILAATFLAASVTHCFTRQLSAKRIARINMALMTEVRDAPSDVQTKRFEIVRRYLMAADASCYLRILIAIPGISFLYGAVSSQITLHRGGILSPKTKTTEIAALSAILLILMLLGTA